MGIKLHEFELWRDRGDDKPLIVRGEARVPDNAKGSVVICHGFKGFAHFSFFPYLAEQLAASGLRSITFDFSGSGVGEDRQNFTNKEAFTNNTYFQELEDLEAVVAEARVHDWIDKDYGLFGHSRGGGMAILHAGRDSDVKALVTWAAISSTNRWSPEAMEEWRQRGYVEIPNSRTGEAIPLSTKLLDEVEAHGDTKLNVAEAASRIKVPWLIVHGAEDETVPVGEAEHLAGLSTGELKVLDGVNHSFGGKHPLEEITPTLKSVTRDTVEFFQKNLTSLAGA